MKILAKIKHDNPSKSNPSKSMHLPYHIMLKREISKRKLPIYLAKKKKSETGILGTCQ
jgi:hypothetical protein